jgi:hypothetical protein
MCKLGLSTDQQLQSANFEKYLKLFEEGLSLEQVKMIHELFSDMVPVLSKPIHDCHSFGTTPLFKAWSFTKGFKPGHHVHK